MKKNTDIQSEIKFKASEFQLNLLIVTQKPSSTKLQFFPTKNNQLKAKTQNIQTKKPGRLRFFPFILNKYT